MATSASTASVTYTSKWGTAEADERYDQLLAAWLANGRRMPSEMPHGGYWVRDLVADFLEHADTYYRKNGEPTKEVVNIKYAVKPLLYLFSELPAEGFGPRRLKVYREALIRQDLSRKLINQRVGIIKRIFTWGTSEEKVSGEVSAALRSVVGLKYGRTKARETRPVASVSEADFEAAVAEMGPQIAAMARIHWLTGMRPGEVVQMRWADIDTTGETWIYSPRSHKTQHHGLERTIPLGPQAQEALSGFRSLQREAYIFRPSEVHSTGLECYTTVSYRRAVSRACKRAGVTHWTPNQLRHSTATRIRKDFGLDAARALLGHTNSKVTETYAELDSGKAVSIMSEVG